MQYLKLGRQLKLGCQLSTVMLMDMLSISAGEDIKASAAEAQAGRQEMMQS